MLEKRMHAQLVELNKIKAEVTNGYYGGVIEIFYLRDLTTNEITKIDIDVKNVEDGKTIYYFIDIDVDLSHLYQVVDEYGLSATLTYDSLVHIKEFDDLFYYDKHDLGCIYNKDYCEFKVWAPTALEVLVKITAANNKKSVSVKMKRQNNGVFYQKVDGDYENFSYVYLVRHDDQFVECLDPYAWSSRSNSTANVIVNIDKIDETLNRDCLEKLNHKTDAIIYEVSVRDFTMDASIEVKHPGKFLGMSQEGVKSNNNNPIGFDYLKDLGITHVQLLPIFDFGTVDENNPTLLYNWGYDPVQYGIPEGSYVSDPNDGYKRINELRHLVAKFHKNGIRVIMDVVYNHVYDTNSHAFERIVPGYFYRRDENGNLCNGSWCGNDLNTTALMVRKYIVDMSLRYQKLYGIDGYRFDLMGIIDTHTINEVFDKCSKKDESFLVYGEGWNMMTAIDESIRSIQENHHKLLNIGFFNDEYRDVLKGGSSDDSLSTPGYFTGALINCELAGICMMNTNRYSYVDQSINYLECHDNATLADKISKSNLNEDYTIRKKRQLMLNVALVLSQGIPFIHAGQEFYISKQGLGNTYNSPDVINAIDWTKVDDNLEDINVLKEVIDLRKNNDGFKYETIEEVKEFVDVSNVNHEVLKYHIKQEKGKYKEFMIYYNPSYTEYQLEDIDDYDVLIGSTKDKKLEGISFKICGKKR